MVHISPQKRAYVWTVSVLVAFMMLAVGLPKIFGGQDWNTQLRALGLSVVVPRAGRLGRK